MPVAIDAASNGPRLPRGPAEGGTSSGGNGPNRTPQLIGALALLLAAVIATVTCVSWVWNKADALSPVALPSANGTPLPTVNPSARPSSTPPPQGRVIGSAMVAANNDRMPVLSSAWSDNEENSGLYGGAATWLTVHKNYDGKNATWGNYVAFGGLARTVPYANTPAGRKEAAVQAGAAALDKLYGKNVKLIGKASQRVISVRGRPGHEITVRVQVRIPQLKETFSTFAVAVVDRGDGTADASIGDFAGSTPQWLSVWRTRVQQITIQR